MVWGPVGTWLRSLTAGIALVPCVAFAQEQLNQQFIPQGPAPSYGTSGIVGSIDDPPNGTVAGAIQAILLDPALGDDTYFIASTNGGIWKTIDGGASWAPLTDSEISLSIASLGLDVTDPTGNTLIAGVGLSSNGNWDAFNRPNDQGSGGLQSGLLYSTDGGLSWESMGSADLAGMSVVGVAARGETVLAATFEIHAPYLTQVGTDGPFYGLYISTDGGENFDLVPQCSQSCSGLPPGPVTSLVAGSDASTFYAAVTSPTDPRSAGVYVSYDTGQTWQPVFTSSTVVSGGDNVIATATQQLDLKLATAPDGSVAIAVAGVESGELRGLYLANSSGSWSALAVPFNDAYAPYSVQNLAITIDPNNTSIVYVAGTEVECHPNVPPCPYVAPVDMVQGSQVTSLNNDSAVHADARVLVINADGNLLLGGDGGIYLRTNPTSNLGSWTGFNTDTLQVREVYSIAYGANAKRLVVAAQDAGVGVQSAPNNPLYNAVQPYDGYTALVSDTTFAGLSVYYTSPQDLSPNFNRLILDANGSTVSPGSDPSGVPITCNGGQACPDGGNYFVVKLNAADQTRLAIAAEHVYVTQDTAPVDATSVDLPLIDIGATLGTPYALAYGTLDNPNVVLVGDWIHENVGALQLSTTATHDSLVPLTAYAGAVPTSLMFDERYEDVFFVADSYNLWSTQDQGGSFIASTLPANIIRPTSLAFINNNGVDALLVGGLSNIADAQSQIAVADSDALGNLSEFRLFGSGLPNALVSSLFYNPVADVLAVGTVGRGAWTLYDVTSYFAQASNLQFGLADNDSRPDALYLTDGTSLVGESFVRELDKYGTGVLTIAGNASYTGGTTIFDGRLQLGTGGTSGSILGNVAFCDDQTDAQCDASSDKFLIFNRSDAYVFDGVISGPGQVVQNGIGTTILTDDSSYTGPTGVEKGALIVNGAVTSDVSVDAGATLAGTGTVGSIDVAGIISPGGSTAPSHGIGTLSVAGDALLADAAYLVDANSAGASDQLIIGRDVTVDDARLLVLAAGGDYASSTSYRIIDKTSAGAISGSFSEITSNSIFVSPSLVYDGGNGNDAVLTLEAIPYETFAQTRNQRAVANALDAGSFGPLAASIFYLDEASVQKAFTQLAGEVHSTTLDILAEDSRYLRQAVLGRTVQGQYQDFGSDVSISPAGGAESLESPVASDVAFWAQAFGAWATYDGNGNAAGGERDLGGFVSGLDVGLDGGWRLGAAAGYGQSSIALDAGAGSADVDTFSLAAYGGGILGPVALRAGAAWSWHDIDTARSVVYPGVFEREKASYDGDTGQIFGELAYPILLGFAAVEPFAGLAYVHVKADGFQEDGGIAALTGKRADEDVGFSTLGLRWAGRLAMGETALMPRASLAWQHGFDELTPETAFAFVNEPAIGFSATGLPIVRDSALIDLGLAVELSPGLTLGASYAGQFATDLQDNAVQGRLAWAF